MSNLATRDPASIGNELFAVALPDECDAAWVSTFHEEFLNKAPLPCDVQVDASEVSRMTTVAVQLLLALSKAVAAENCQFGVEAASPAFRSAFADLGLGETLLLWGAK